MPKKGMMKINILNKKPAKKTPAGKVLNPMTGRYVKVGGITHQLMLCKKKEHKKFAKNQKEVDNFFKQRKKDIKIKKTRDKGVKEAAELAKYRAQQDFYIKQITDDIKREAAEARAKQKKFAENQKEVDAFFKQRRAKFATEKLVKGRIANKKLTTQQAAILGGIKMKRKATERLVKRRITNKKITAQQAAILGGIKMKRKARDAKTQARKGMAGQAMKRATAKAKATAKKKAEFKKKQQAIKHTIAGKRARGPMKKPKLSYAKSVGAKKKVRAGLSFKDVLSGKSRRVS